MSTTRLECTGPASLYKPHPPRRSHGFFPTPTVVNPDILPCTGCCHDTHHAYHLPLQGAAAYTVSRTSFALDACLSRALGEPVVPRASATAHQQVSFLFVKKVPLPPDLSATRKCHLHRRERAVLASSPSRHRSRSGRRTRYGTKARLAVQDCSRAAARRVCSPPRQEGCPAQGRPQPRLKRLPQPTNFIYTPTLCLAVLLNSRDEPIQHGSAPHPCPPQPRLTAQRTSRRNIQTLHRLDRSGVVATARFGIVERSVRGGHTACSCHLSARPSTPTFSRLLSRIEVLNYYRR
ncbi:hypothetical protein BKA62DRAFT_95971 [Auriculariales sp. MPI-PUGE-AT-0066]|nr:hypothetical protein BKA62DRAFT_95971 [Auriculariales sp. MPI-PUGE-AT-0066]